MSTPQVPQAITGLVSSMKTQQASALVDAQKALDELRTIHPQPPAVNAAIIYIQGVLGTGGAVASNLNVLTSELASFNTQLSHCSCPDQTGTQNKNQ